MERRRDTLGPSSRHVGVFLFTCALHASAIYFATSLLVAEHAPQWSTLQVSFIPVKPVDPPPPPPIPVLLTDAFAERQLMDIAAPELQIAVPVEVSRAIQAPTPDPLPQANSAPQKEEGYGPLIKPRVLSGPKSQSRYPRESISQKESGRTVVKICISATATVDDVSVAKSSGYSRLDRAAVDIGRDYLFTPAMRGGQAVAVCLPYGITFRIATGGGSQRWH